MLQPILMNTLRNIRGSIRRLGITYADVREDGTRHEVEGAGVSADDVGGRVIRPQCTDTQKHHHWDQWSVRFPRGTHLARPVSVRPASHNTTFTAVWISRNFLSTRTYTISIITKLHL